MRKICLSASIAALCIFLVACGRGTGIVENAQIDTGASDRFTQEEIVFAMDAVKEHFRDSYDRWNELIALWYDEDWSDWKIDRSGLDKENTIILRSELYIGQGFGNDAQRTPLFWVLFWSNSSDSWVVNSWGKG